jgi:calcium-dependent protein kinase
MGCTTSSLATDASTKQGRYHANTRQRLSWSRSGDARKTYEIDTIIREGSISNIYQVHKKQRTAGSAKKSGCNEPFTYHPSSAKELAKLVEYYAFKEIDLNLVEPGRQDEMTNEVNLLHSIDHPNIIQAFDVYKDRHNYLAMILELCQGGDLHSRAPYTNFQAARIIRQIIDAVHYLHTHNVVHCDLSMENVMFESSSPTDWNVKMIDFGLAVKYLPTNSAMQGRGRTAITMAPEVLPGKYTSQADMWSVGVITYQLLSGDAPIDGNDARGSARRAYMSGLNDFSDPTWKRASAEATNFCEHLLNVDPDLRYTAKQALRHPWMPRPNGKANKRDLLRAISSMESFSKNTDFRKLALNIMAYKATADEIVKLRKVFGYVDTGEDGYITYGEFHKALEATGQYPPEQIRRLFQSLDVDESRTIEYTEFLAATTNIPINDLDLAEVFKRFDADDTGYISKDNLRSILGSDTSDEYIDKLLHEVDLNNDGKVSYSEFRQAFADKMEVGVVQQ